MFITVKGSSIIQNAQHFLKNEKFYLFPIIFYSHAGYKLYNVTYKNDSLTMSERFVQVNKKTVFSIKALRDEKKQADIKM